MLQVPIKLQRDENWNVAFIAENFTVIKVRKVKASFTPVCAPSEVVITNIHPMTSNEARKELQVNLEQCLILEEMRKGTMLLYSSFRRTSARKSNKNCVRSVTLTVVSLTHYDCDGRSLIITTSVVRKKKKTEEQLEKDDQIDEIMEEAEGSGKPMKLKKR